MSLHDYQRIEAGLSGVADPVRFLIDLFAHAPVGFAVWTADGHALLANKAFVDIFLVEPPPEYNVLEDEQLDKSGLGTLFRRAFAGEVVQVPTFWYDPRDHTTIKVTHGRRVAISMAIFPLFKQSGELHYVAATYKDETDLMLANESLQVAEAAARNSEAHKAAVLETALDAIVLTDEQGNITDFNPAAEKTFGYARHEALGKPIAELLVPKPQRSAHAAGFRRYLETGVGPILGKRVEVSALRADGTEFPAELAVVPIRVGESLSFTGYIRDISERVRAERALKAAEARFRHLAESGIIGIIIADTSGNILDANEAFLSMLGYSRDDVTAGTLRWADMTPPEWRALDDFAIEQLKQHGVARAWEKEYLRRDGSRVPVVVGVALVDPDTGIAFVLDLSERKRAEEARAFAEAALDKAEERLRQSQKMEAIGTLAGSIAHDFNNLLSVILGYVESLVGDLRAGDPMRADLEEIGRAGKRAEELTRQLLAFSRRQILQPKVLDLNLAIADMARMLERIIGEDIELSFVPAPNLGAVYVDPGQIEQVLLNLVVNARDAMPKGGKLTIETGEHFLDQDYLSAEHVAVEPGRYVALSVCDTGSGMDRDTQTRIFEPFFSTKGPGKGTGLGLSTVHGIVHQSGGHIRVQSELGSGATFVVYLPRKDPALQPAERELPAASLRGSETILLVEDEEQVRHLLGTILRRHGYQVLTAETSGDALLISEQHQGPIQLLLTDVVMPRTSGRQLWERLGPLRPDMKVLFMSGYTDDAVLRHGVQSSELDFIQKPVSPATLLAKLRAVLDAKA